MHPLPEDPERPRDTAATPPTTRKSSRFLANLVAILMTPFLLLLLIIGLLAMDDIGGPIALLVLGATAFVTYKCTRAIQSSDGSGLGWILAGVALLIFALLTYAYGAMGFIGLWNNRLWWQ